MSAHWPPEAVDFYSMSEDGTRKPIRANGLRILLAADTWVALDLERHAYAPIQVSVAVRSTDPSKGLPRLTIEPRAGSSVSVAIEGRAGGVSSVAYSDLAGNPKEWVAQTRSGDPLGELLADDKRRPLNERRFRIESDDQWVDIAVDSAEADTLRVRLEPGTEALPTPGQPFCTLDMLMRVHASNLVSMLFRKVEGVILGAPPQNP